MIPIMESLITNCFISTNSRKEQQKFVIDYQIFAAQDLKNKNEGKNYK